MPGQPQPDPPQSARTLRKRAAEWGELAGLLMVMLVGVAFAIITTLLFLGVRDSIFTSWLPF